MSSNGKHRSTKPVTNEQGKKVTPVTGLPASQRVICPICTSCRNVDTFIYATRGSIRYCKCRYCGHTYTHVATVVDNIQTR
jgi:uncharacterized protein (DUF983 family)